MIYPNAHSGQALVAEGARARRHNILVEEQTSGFYDATFGLLIVPEEGE
ncbi:MAG TPA: hypothetical protein VNA27_00095 [Rubrobacteraceae bacterium]|nr:hypothetical protein [Rubrobacteraceae bacterium]